MSDFNKVMAMVDAGLKALELAEAAAKAFTKSAAEAREKLSHALGELAEMESALAAGDAAADTALDAKFK